MSQTQQISSPYLGKDTTSRRKVSRVGGEVIFIDSVVVLDEPEPIASNPPVCKGRISKKHLAEMAHKNMPPQSWFDEPAADLTKPV